MNKRISLTVLELVSLGILASCGQPGEEGAPPESTSRVSQELRGCATTAPVKSRIKSPVVITPDSIAGDDLMTPNYIVVKFHGAGVPTCVGDEINQTRYFHLPMSDYIPMTAALAAGLTVQIRGREGPAHHFTRVGW